MNKVKVFHIMKKKFIIILITILSTCLFPLSGVKANLVTDNLFTGSSAYFVFDLEKNDILIANLTSYSDDAEFTMYLINSRPLDESLQTENIVAEGLNMSYNATNTQIYYLQIYLSVNGPATFQLNITKNGEDFSLIRYYIPQIPGFPLELLIITILGGFGTILFFWKQKRKLKFEKYG